MLNFLNPFILFALPVIIIPILIHFLNRTKRKEIPFSTIHFLKQMIHREIRKLRLRQILLMVVRIFLILFLILAFARPTLRSDIGPISDDTASEIVFIIDNRIKTKHIANIFGFYVKMKYRGQEVGTKLMESALEIIQKNMKVSKIKLTVNPEQKVAVKLYEKYGFELVGRLKNELKVDDKLYDELIMERLL